LQLQLAASNYLQLQLLLLLSAVTPAITKRSSSAKHALNA